MGSSLVYRWAVARITSGLWWGIQVGCGCALQYINKFDVKTFFHRNLFFLKSWPGFMSKI